MISNKQRKGSIEVKPLNDNRWAVIKNDLTLKVFHDQDSAVEYARSIVFSENLDSRAFQDEALKRAIFR